MATNIKEVFLGCDVWLDFFSQVLALIVTIYQPAQTVFQCLHPASVWDQSQQGDYFSEGHHS